MENPESVVQNNLARKTEKIVFILGVSKII